jgi:hypothetical protein
MGDIEALVKMLLCYLIEDNGSLDAQDLAAIGYAGAVKPPVRRTGNRQSGHEETDIFAAEPPSRESRSPGWGRLLTGFQLLA